jgi:hypothetical protein
MSRNYCVTLNNSLKFNNQINIFNFECTLIYMNIVVKGKINFSLMRYLFISSLYDNFIDYIFQY